MSPPYRDEPVDPALRPAIAKQRLVFARAALERAKDLERFFKKALSNAKSEESSERRVALVLDDTEWGALFGWNGVVPSRSPEQRQLDVARATAARTSAERVLEIVRDRVASLTEACKVLDTEARNAPPITAEVTQIAAREAALEIRQLVDVLCAMLDRLHARSETIRGAAIQAALSGGDAIDDATNSAFVAAEAELAVARAGARIVQASIASLAAGAALATHARDAVDACDATTRHAPDYEWGLKIAAAQKAAHALRDAIAAELG